MTLDIEPEEGQALAGEAGADDVALTPAARLAGYMRGGGIVVKAHFTWSGCCGRIEQSTIGFSARITSGAAAKLPAETQPLANMFTLSDEIIFR